MKKILLVGGVDNSGGAGILADKETLVTLEAGASAAITAITAQTDEKFHDSHAIPAGILKMQLNSIDSNEIGAIKIGMLPNSETVEVLAEFLDQHRSLPSVLDPVFSSSSGGELCSSHGIECLRSLLLPLVSLLTPNLSEAQHLADLPSADSQDLSSLSNAWLKLGAKAVLVKGGHLPGNICLDLLAQHGKKEVVFERPRIPDGVQVRGTGCRLATAIAWYLSQKKDFPEAVKHAGDFVHAYIQRQACGGKAFEK